MKNLIRYSGFVLCISLTIVLASCGKAEDATVTGNARIAVTNAATEAPALDAFIDNEKITTGPLAFGSTSGIAGNPYLNINAGLRFMSISQDGTTNLVSGNVPFATDSSYSVFVYDTLNISGTLKALLLTDILTAPAAGKAHLRFLQLSPDTGKINIQLVNTADTITVGDRPYIGSTTIDATLQTFTAVNPGTYTVNVRKAATAAIIYSTTVTMGDGRIYSLYARGRKASGNPATTFNINSISHN